MQAHQAFHNDHTDADLLTVMFLLEILFDFVHKNGQRESILQLLISKSSSNLEKKNHTEKYGIDTFVFCGLY